MKYPQPLYSYQGTETPEYTNMLFVRLAEFDAAKDKKQSKNKWPDPADEWKFGFGQDTVFMISIAENQYQPPPVQKLLCSVIETPEDVAVGDKGIGGCIWMGDQKAFKRDFKQKGVQ